MEQSSETKSEAKDIRDVFGNTSLTHIHRSWKKDWAPSIQSEDLRKSIEGTPRLAKRLTAHIVQDATTHLKGHAFSKDAENDLLEQKKLLLHSFGDNAHATHSRRIGLILLAQTIRAILNTDSAPNLLKSINKEDLRYALDHQDVSFGVQDIQTGLINQEVDLCGLTSLILWAKTFPDDIAKLLLVRLPKTKTLSKYLEDEATALRVTELVLGQGGA